MKLGRKLRQKSLEAEKAAMEKRIKEELDAVTTTEEAIALQRSPTHTDADKARAQPPCSSAHFNRTTVRIGKGGDTIKAISSETGARVDIAREGNDKGAIQISGTPEQIRARPAPCTSRSVRRALLMPQVIAGSIYRCGKRT